MRRKTLLLLLLAAITMIMGQAGLSAFLPSLLRREFGMQIEQVGVFMALIHGLGGAIGMPAGGFLSDFVSKRSVAMAPRIVGLIVLVAAPLALFGCFAVDVWTAGACFFVYSVLVHMYLGPTLATYLTIAPVELRGAMSAAMLVGMNLIGTGVGPQLTGVWSDLLSNAGIEQPLRIALALATSWFFLSAIFYLAAGGSATKDAAAVDAGEQSPADAATA
jgi:MFS family permease